MVLYILTFTFLDSRREDKRLNRMVASIPRTESAIRLFMHVISNTEKFKNRRFIMLHTSNGNFMLPS
jgi:hypothetical protein